MDHLDIDVCDVLVLTVCEHLPSEVVTQCINVNPFPTLLWISTIGIVADFGRLPTAPMAAYDRSGDCTHRPRTSSDGP